jgi:hypothetical protein
MRRTLGALALATLALTACSQETPDDADSSPAPQETIAESTVDVDLGEWSVIADPLQAPAGTITFEIKNGGAEEHELVIVAADGREAGDLPTADDGSVDEDGVEVITEAEAIAAGKGAQIDHDLDTGDYILFCNVVSESDGETNVHYKLGMRTTFTVT